jgi:hypothetical protein
MGEHRDDLGGEAQAAPRRSARHARRAAFQTAEAGESLGGAATDFAEDLRGAAANLLDEQKAHMADLAHGFATALRRSADAFAAEGGTIVAHYADQMADRVDHLSDAVRNQAWRDLLANVEDTARRRPELVLAGAVAAGFVLVRMMTGAAPRDAAER